MNTLTEIDFAILDLIHENLSCKALDIVMPIITFMGSGGAVWLIAAAVLLFFRGYRKNGAMLLAGLAICFIAGNLLLKNLVMRPRPCWLNESAALLVAMPDDYSFPSGHSSSSFAAAVILFHADKRIGTAAFVLAAFIAFSRLYLYVHFPSDVLAGILLGCAVGIIVCLVGDKIVRER